MEMNANKNRKVRKSNVPIDSGWAWVCCFGSFISMYYAVGAFKSMGVLFAALIQHFDSSASVTSLVMGLSCAGLAIFSPVASILSDRYGHRKVVMSGAIFSALGPLITAFAPNIYFAVIVFGLLNGIGNAFMLTPSLILVTKYFKRWRTVANGMAMAGGSLGQLTIPWLLEYWLERYHLRGTLILYSSHFLHALIGGALLRPISFYDTTDLDIPEDDSCKEEKQPLNRNSDGDIVIQCNEVFDDDELEPRYSRPAKQVEPELPMLPFSLFRNPLYASYVVAICLGNCGYMDSILFLPSLSKEHDTSLGLPPATIAMNSSTLMSLLAIFDLIGRVGGGFIADYRCIKRSLFSSCCLFTISGIALLVSMSYYIAGEFYILAIALGLCGGLYSSVFPIVLMDYVGMSVFPRALSFSFLFMGLTNTAIPPLLGLLQDYSGTFRLVYMITSFMMFGAGILYASEQIFRRLKFFKNSSNSPYLRK